MTRPRPSLSVQCGMAAVLALAIVLSSHAQTAAQPPLEQVTLNAGVYRIEAEVAYSDATRQIGLMFRRQMAANHGMLFVFPHDVQECMWMKNTLLPLSVAFIDAQGVIRNIGDMVPQTETPHCSAVPVRYALEMNRGWFSGRRIAPGERLQGLDRAPPAR
jgi:uncharacterized protein